MHRDRAKYVVFYEFNGEVLHHMFNSFDLAFIFFEMIESQNNPVLMKRPKDL